MKDLEKEILIKASKEKEAIINEAKKVADDSALSAIRKLDENYASKLAQLKKNHEENLKLDSSKAFRYYAQQNELIKKEYLDEVFSKALKLLMGLEGQELLLLVAGLIKKERIIGDEIIYVKNEEYPKYLKALSSKETLELVECDLLAAHLGGLKLKLAKTSNVRTFGFVLSRSEYDLNFDFSLLLEELKETRELEISEMLESE